MSTESSILAVVRASRPNFRNPNDKIAFFVHAAFLSAGYALIATGDKAFEENPPTDGEEIGIDGWNSSEDGYAFVYVKSDNGEERSILVKCIAIGFALVVDVLNLKDDSKEPLHVQINIKDHVEEEDKHSNYAEMYKNLRGLVQILNTGIFKNLVTRNQSRSSTSSRSKNARENRSNAGMFPYERQQPPPFLHSPPIPSVRGGDLYPGPFAGVLPTRVPGIIGGMLVGPNDPRFFPGPGLHSYEAELIAMDTILLNQVRPPDVPGFGPQHFARRPRRRGGGGGGSS